MLCPGSVLASSSLSSLCPYYTVSFSFSFSFSYTGWQTPHRCWMSCLVSPSSNPSWERNPSWRVTLSHTSLRHTPSLRSYCVYKMRKTQLWHSSTNFGRATPKVDCKCFVGGKDGILNHMGHYMSPGYEEAKYCVHHIKASTEIILRHGGASEQPHGGTGTSDTIHYWLGRPGSNRGKCVRQWEWGVWHGITLPSHVCDMSCIIGMLYLLIKPEIDELNTMSWFGRFLGEDFFITKHYIYCAPLRMPYLSSHRI